MAGDGFAFAMDAIIKNAEKNQEHDSTDYKNPDDGLLYCGKCHSAAP